MEYPNSKKEGIIDSSTTWVNLKNTMLKQKRLDTKAYMLSSFIYMKLEGHLGGSVGWVSNSWFQLRSWSQGCGIEPRIRQCTECGACLRFSPSLSLSQINFFKICLLKFFNVYLSERPRKTECEQRKGRKRGRHRIRSRLQAPGSKLSAQSPTWGSNPQTVRSWPELKSNA